MSQSPDYSFDNSDDISKALNDFADKLISSQKDLPPEFKKILNDNFYELLEE